MNYKIPGSNFKPFSNVVYSFRLIYPIYYYDLYRIIYTSNIFQISSTQFKI